MDPKESSLIMRLGNKHVFPRRHLTDPKLLFEHQNTINVWMEDVPLPWSEEGITNLT